MLNKKSITHDLLALLSLILVLVFVFLYIILAEFGSATKTQQIIGKKIIVRDAHDILLYYLKSPLTISGFSESNIADGISYYSIKEDADLLNKIKIMTDDYFSKSALETDYSSYSLEISYAGKELIIESEKSRTQLVARELLSATAIPIPHKGDLIIIKLFLVTTRFVSK